MIWFVTSGEDRKPLAVPVWFVWDGKSFLVYARDGAKVRDVQENPLVELHLNSDDAGDDVVRVSGRAIIAARPPRRLTPAYLRKYARSIKDLEMTPQSFLDEYHNEIRVTQLRYH